MHVESRLGSTVPNGQWEYACVILADREAIPQAVEIPMGGSSCDSILRKRVVGGKKLPLLRRGDSCPNRKVIPALVLRYP